MKIKSISISGYRQFKNITVNMEDEITIIAGANNSGKTSLVELFNIVFGKTKRKFCCDDLSIKDCNEWSDKVFPLIKKSFNDEKEKETTISKVLDSIFPFNDNSEKILMPSIEIKIQIDYKEDTDDIRNFADYLMDLDPNSHSFYFIYKYSISKDTFKNNLELNYKKFNSRFSKLEDNDDEKVIRVIKDMIVSLYFESSKETVFFTDKNYKNDVIIENEVFKQLFNYRNIMASRKLDDESSDKTKTLSKNVIDIAIDDDNWEKLTSNLPDEIIQLLQKEEIQKIVRKTSLDILRDTMRSIEKTNGGNTGNIILDMNITESRIQSLFKDITTAKFQSEDFYLKESSQGLGYSNLIYIILQLEKYKNSIKGGEKSADQNLINFFVIEEPEAHMHPQMQNVFTKYLFDYFKDKKNMQGFITTHSSEVIRSAKMEQLRVLRHISLFECKLFDLHDFSNKLPTNLKEFYNLLYEINFSDIIFADKIIMYEGDTEKMLIKSLLNLKEFNMLSSQYLSFVQVGGAYAYNYKSIIELLKIKTIIITDLDYNIEANDINKIKDSTTTNATLNSFYNEFFSKKNPKIGELYNWKSSGNIIMSNDLIYLAFQSEVDGYARTLEEAMLSKLYDIKTFEKKSIVEWKELRKKDKLKYTIPYEVDSCNLRDIVLHTSSGKTNFMYSVIINKMEEKMLPDYIKKALLWLIQ